MPHPYDRSRGAVPARRDTAAATLRTTTDAAGRTSVRRRLPSYAAGSREASALPTPPLPLRGSAGALRRTLADGPPPEHRPIGRSGGPGRERRRAGAGVQRV